MSSASTTLAIIGVCLAVCCSAKICSPSEHAAPSNQQCSGGAEHAGTLPWLSAFQDTPPRQRECSAATAVACAERTGAGGGGASDFGNNSIKDSVNAGGKSFLASFNIIQEDVVSKDLTLHMLQRASWNKIHMAIVNRNVTGESTSLVERHDPPVLRANRPHLDKQAWKARVSPCIMEAQSAGLIPLAVDVQLQLQVFHKLGLLQRAVPRCLHRSFLTLGSKVPTAGEVHHKNLIAKWCIGIFMTCIIGLVIWVLLSVSVVPSKKDKDHSLKSGALPVCDESAAFSRGRLNWISLGWVDPLVGKYGRSPGALMDDTDVSQQGEDYEPDKMFRNAWDEEVRTKGIEDASVVGVLLRVIGWKTLIALVIANGTDLFAQTIGMVVALDVFLDYLENMNDIALAHPDEPQSLLEPTLICMLLLYGIPTLSRYASILMSMLDGYYGSHMAASMAAVIYEKALTLSVGTTTNISLGDTPDEAVPDKEKPNVVQLLNTDIYEAWTSLIQITANTVLAPFILLALFCMLVDQFHLAGLFGTLYCVPAALMVGVLAAMLIHFWKNYQKYQDKRLRYLTEILQAIRVIKSLAWETLAYNRLHTIRVQELRVNQRVSCFMGAIYGCIFQLPWFTMLITVAVVVGRQGDIPAHKILVIQRIMSSLLSLAQQSLFSLNKFVTIPNSFRRIKAFLSLEESPRNVIQPLPLSTPSTAVRIRGGFSFAKAAPAVLKNLDNTILKGELVGVCGSVASGKTSFLQAIIGELFADGDAFVEAPLPGSHRVAYCGQVPWIFEGTLRENVVMGGEFIPDRFYKALYAAGLTPDLQILPGGDQVTIGSHGIRLSGGQKARVALARAVYMQEAELFLFDDPLASVDVPTADHIENELLHGPLLRGRTRVVAIQPDYRRLRRFDRVLVVQEGQIVLDGPPSEVLEQDAFKKLVIASEQERGDLSKASADDGSIAGAEVTASICRKKEHEEDAMDLRDKEYQDHVTWQTYRWWVGAAGVGNLFFFVVVAGTSRLCALGTQFILADWVNSKLDATPTDNYVYMRYVLYMVLLASGFYTLLAYASSRLSVSSATALHAQVVRKILHAPVDKFFDKQPIGRLINRLSGDMREVDDAVAGVMMFLFAFGSGTIITQAYIWGVSAWPLIIGAIPLWAAMLYIMYLFKNTMVPLVFHCKFALSKQQDLQAVVLSSCTSIRANSMVGSFLKKYNTATGSVMGATYTQYGILRAWMQSRTFMIVTVLTNMYVLGGLWNGMPMGTLSTVITLQFAAMGEFEQLSYIVCQFLNVLNALQRLTSYFDIPQEAAVELPDDPKVRMMVMTSHDEFAELEVRSGKEALAHLPPSWPCQVVVCLRRGGRALLRGSADGIALEPLNGSSDLCAMAPSCEALRKTVRSYNIVAVNDVSNDVLRMAQELTREAGTVWMDLWDTNYAQGMSVKMENLTAGYGLDKDVLHSINIDIPPRMKVGIAGKTGCGKSTALLCLLRILEPRFGDILVGGRNVRKLGLNCLRSLVGLVPQDPTIFAGSWRRNIDPFDEFPDGRIWEALHRVQLLPFVRALEAGIDSELLEDGANMSFGQRQLLSLARMVIRQPPVLLLDECTSALDPATQAAAQHALLNDFPLSTIVAIAHRVETLLDFDRIVVLSNGVVAEDGTVREVLNIKNGIFAEMVAYSDATKSLDQCKASSS